MYFINRLFQLYLRLSALGYPLSDPITYPFNASAWSSFFSA